MRAVNLAVVCVAALASATTAPLPKAGSQLHASVDVTPRGNAAHSLKALRARLNPKHELRTDTSSQLMPAPGFKDLFRVGLRSGPSELGGPAAATGSVQFNMADQGWNYLTVTTNASYADDLQAYAAGYLEASLTQQQMVQEIFNQGANATVAPVLTEFLRENAAFMHQQILSSNGDEYWHQLWLTLLQLQGLYDGYIDNLQNAVDWVPFSTVLNLQLVGDMEDLATALGLQKFGTPLPVPRLVNREKHRSLAGLPSHQPTARQYVPLGADGAEAMLQPTTEGGGHCSAVVRVLPNATDILFSQISWSGFEDMLRVFKRYELFYSVDGVGPSGALPGRQMVFSSYPGGLFSGDDFYAMQPSSLAMLETTIGNGNQTLYELYVKPTTVLEWARNVVANRLATDGPSWAAVYSRYNSGTYNNENFVLDFKLFTPGAPLADNLLWVVDQAPGFIEASDYTAYLRSDGYFASYNIASSPFIFNITGGAAAEEQYGPWFSWHDTARANIFRRDAPNVVDEEGFRRLVRYNDYLHDPLSTQGCTGNPPSSAENAIAARDDLNPASGVYSIGALGHRDHAAIDAKYTSYSHMNAPGGVVTVAVSGPTWDQQPVFAWSTTTPDIAALPHEGQPDSWAMPWVALQWSDDTSAGPVEVQPLA